MADLHLQCKVAGRFKFEAVKADGSRRLLSPWNENLILNAGLNRMATMADYLGFCQVGTGSSTPTATQTALDSRIASVQITTGTLTAAPSAPYYVSFVRVYTFAQGVATGNLSEVGVGWGGTGTTLFSRSLIKDAGGSPTTITVLADESLEVTYELRYYAPPSDVTGSIVATGNIGGTYAYTLRNSEVQLVNESGNGWVLPYPQSGNAGGISVTAYSGPIGSQTARPSGTSSNAANATSASYVAGSFQLDRIITIAANQGNFSGGLRSIYAKIGIGAYQIEFAPPIPKTSNDVVALTLTISWARQE